MRIRCKCFKIVQNIVLYTNGPISYKIKSNEFKWIDEWNWKSVYLVDKFIVLFTSTQQILFLCDSFCCCCWWFEFCLNQLKCDFNNQPYGLVSMKRVSYLKMPYKMYCKCTGKSIHIHPIGYSCGVACGVFAVFTYSVWM